MLVSCRDIPLKVNAFMGALMAFMLLTQTVPAQVVINEVCPRNFHTVTDQFGKFEDWIELENLGTEAVNLGGWHLSDDPANPAKWTFPEVRIDPGSRLVVFASGKNLKARVDHWENVIFAEQEWRYWLPGGEPDPLWKEPDFDDSEWLTGPGGFGRGDGDDNTILPDSIPTVYIRKTFQVPDTSQIEWVILHMDYDDGFVAYLNGTEIARANIGYPGKIHAWDDYTYDVHTAQMFLGLPPEEFIIDMEVFRQAIREGDNLLAIQGLNAWNNHGNSSLIPFLSFGIADTCFTWFDMPGWFEGKHIFQHTGFRLSGDGEQVFLSSPSGSPVDLVDFPMLHTDHSWGRWPEGSSQWCLFSLPTPGGLNDTVTSYTGYTTAPEFSMPGGFYNDPPTIGFTDWLPGDTIRFTRDGSVPSDTSELYTFPFIVDTTTVIRARTFCSGRLPGTTATATYIIGDSCTLPVVSVAMNPHDLWDWEEGIYVKGPNAGTQFPYFGANFWQEWVKPAHIELYEPDGTFGFGQDAGVMIHGGWSRAYPMKSLRILFRDEFGHSEVIYPIFPGRTNIHYRCFILRNSGQDFNVTHFRDALMHKMVEHETAIDIQDYRPAVVFLNGQYWGIHNLREKIDEDYVAGNWGIDPDSVSILRDNINAVCGNYYHYARMIDYLTHFQTLDTAAYDSTAKLLDIANYTDYFLSEIFYTNADWPNNNIKYWRKNDDTTRWRYIITDSDFGLGLYSSPNKNELYRILHGNIPWTDNHTILRKLITFSPYRIGFINRNCDLLNTTFTPERIAAWVEMFRQRLLPEMGRHLEKWGGGMIGWEENIQTINQFTEARVGYVRQHFQNEFNLEKQVSLTLDADSTRHGLILINSITPDTLPWSGIYFDGNPIRITAVPDSGFLFSHWTSSLLLQGNDTLMASLVFNPDTNDTFIAWFLPDTIIPDTPSVIFTEINYRPADTLNTGDWVEIYNGDTVMHDLSGWVFRDGDDMHTFILPGQTLLDTGAFLVLCQDTLLFGMIYPEVKNAVGPFGFGLAREGENIRLFSPGGIPVAGVLYSNQPPWPPEPDGTGRTLEILDYSGDPNDPWNWFAGCPGGSPGRAFEECDTLRIPVTGHLSTQLLVFPNPARDQLNLSICSGEPKNLQVALYHISGIPIRKTQINSGVTGCADHEMIISHLAAGIYYLHVTGPGVSTGLRIIIR
ncbi:MAG: CotH kinase family protein [Bacteroidales bacterium]|nr:CotH kinase family protein [Bacteroidales bacterium]